MRVSPPLSRHHILPRPYFGDAASLSQVLPCVFALGGEQRQEGEEKALTSFGWGNLRWLSAEPEQAALGL